MNIAIDTIRLCWLKQHVHCGRSLTVRPLLNSTNNVYKKYSNALMEEELFFLHNAFLTLDDDIGPTRKYHNQRFDGEKSRWRKKFLHQE